jgi:hypothetical protein
VREDQLIRWNNSCAGSLIWNTAERNRSLIQDHAFWEIGNGTTTLFWTDSWQQLLPLDQQQWHENLQPHTERARLKAVADFWCPEGQQDTSRQWKTKEEELGSLNHLSLEQWQAEANMRRIKVKHGPDILSWGHTPKGTFTIKEAYGLKANFSTLPKAPIWSNIWDSKLWPKISTFLWLVGHKTIFTWDNLMKRGFIGPSIYHLSLKSKETQEHLLNQCSFSSLIWDQGTLMMRTSDRNREGVDNTIIG